MLRKLKQMNCSERELRKLHNLLICRYAKPSRRLFDVCTREQNRPDDFLTLALASKTVCNTLYLAPVGSRPLRQYQ